MTRRIFIGVAIVGLLLCFSLPASAQTTTGRIVGQVTGLEGYPMPGVTVTASSAAIMGGSRTAVSGETGAYRFAALPPGVYTVKAELTGFRPLTIEGVSVSIGGSGTADFILQAEFSDEMVVTSESPLLDATSFGRSLHLHRRLPQGPPDHPQLLRHHGGVAGCQPRRRGR